MILFGKIEFKLGSNDIIKPKAISGNVIVFGIIKFLRSIKNMTINYKLKIISNKVVNVIPYK